jgi:heme-degrading monooxygenase HmoA
VQERVRVLGARVPPEKIEEVERAYHDSLLHVTERHRGFRSLVLLWNADTGEALEVTLWEDEEARRSSEEEGGPVPRKVEALGKILGEKPAVRSYEMRIVL